MPLTTPILNSERIDDGLDGTGRLQDASTSRDDVVAAERFPTFRELSRERLGLSEAEKPGLRAIARHSRRLFLQSAPALRIRARFADVPGAFATAASRREPPGMTRAASCSPLHSAVPNVWIFLGLNVFSQ